MEDTINKKIIKATKWSTITEVLAKLIVPITNLILARILAPEAFGVIATVTMVTSFADMLTDAGFQKYIIQHEFKDDKNLYENANVAFLTNFSISMFSWIIIAIFRNNIASILGNDGLGFAIVVASLQLPITALSSIQMAIYKRKLDFKTLFYRRIISVLLPFFVTIPLALLGMDYWSLIIGTLAGQILNAIILTIKSEWKPKIYFKFDVLKDMFSFSMWTLIDSIVVWLCSYVDVFILGNIFNSYYLGLYNNSINIVNAIMNIITTSITPVLLSGLSKYQSDESKYKELLFKFQRIMACLLIPMGVGISIYRELVTNILLGPEWKEAANIIGVMSLTVPFTILLSNCTSICYISKGKPKLSIVTQLSYLIPLVPISIYIANKGFWEYVYVRNILKIELMIANLIVLNFIIKIPALELIKNLFKPIVATILMSIIAIILISLSKNTVYTFFSIFVCIVVYFVVLYLIDKDDFEDVKDKFFKRRKENEHIQKNIFKGCQ